MKKALRAEGFYEAAARVEVTADEDGDEAAAVFTATPGRPFTLVAHEFDFEGATLWDAPPAAAALGSPLDQRAAAAKILAVEAAVVAGFRRGGHPYAAFVSRTVEADFDRAELRVESRFAPGPRAVFGPLTFQGAEAVDRRYLESYRTWVEGHAYDEEAVAAFQRALAGTRLFRIATVAKPARPPEDEGAPAALPVLVEVSPAPPRSVGLGARFSTDGGPEARVSFEHRNLLGANERLSAVLDGGAEDQSLTLEFRKPQFRRAGQDLVAAAELRQDRGDAFDELAADLSLGLDRKIGRLLGGEARIGLGALAEISVVEDSSAAGGSAEDETAYLGGLPFYLAIDARDDPLDPTKGFRLRVAATPFAGVLDDASTAFLSVDAEGAAYRALDREARWVLAARARLGAVISEDLADIPAPRRLYSGGGGSVRGYAERFVGPLDASGDPIGGRSVIELGGELPLEGDRGFRRGAVRGGRRGVA